MSVSCFVIPGVPDLHQVQSTTIWNLTTMSPLNLFGLYIYSGCSTLVRLFNDFVVVKKLNNYQRLLSSNIRALSWCVSSTYVLLEISSWNWLSEYHLWETIPAIEGLIEFPFHVCYAHSSFRWSIRSESCQGYWFISDHSKAPHTSSPQCQVSLIWYSSLPISCYLDIKNEQMRWETRFRSVRTVGWLFPETTMSFFLGQVARCRTAGRGIRHRCELWSHWWILMCLINNFTDWRVEPTGWRYFEFGERVHLQFHHRIYWLITSTINSGL